jgi:hypothetical protein
MRIGIDIIIVFARDLYESLVKSPQIFLLKSRYLKKQELEDHFSTPCK